MPRGTLHRCTSDIFQSGRVKRRIQDRRSFMIAANKAWTHGEMFDGSKTLWKVPTQQTPHLEGLCHASLMSPFLLCRTLTVHKYKAFPNATNAVFPLLLCRTKCTDSVPCQRGYMYMSVSVLWKHWLILQQTSWKTLQERADLDDGCQHFYGVSKVPFVAKDKPLLWIVIFMPLLFSKLNKAQLK